MHSPRESIMQGECSQTALSAILICSLVLWEAANHPLIHSIQLEFKFQTGSSWNQRKLIPQ